MSSRLHVFEFLSNAQVPTVGACVLFGTDRFLKTLAIQRLTGAGSQSANESTAGFSTSKFDSSSTSWQDVHDELSTRSLFGGGGPRIVIVDHADKFVSNNRDRLETFAEGSGGSGLLVLVVDNWVKSTRLYKRVDKHGLHIDCGPPKKSARAKSPDPAQVKSWLIARAQQAHGFVLPNQGAQLLMDLTECEFGRMEQEMCKLALFADDDGQVSLETIKQVVGGWRARTMWDALDAAVAGNTGQALDLLDLIFRGGEHPLALFGSLAWSLRRYANATEEVLRQMRSGRKPNLPSALKSSGLGGWGSENAASQLKQIGSQRARQLSQWLLEADLQLKRSHSLPSRGRIVLEKLFIRLAAELKA